MKKTESISRECCGGKKISLTISVEADDDSFSEDEQRDAISEFGVMAQYLLTDLENIIGYPKTASPRTGRSGGLSGGEIKKHFGIDDDTDFSVFDSKKLARMLVALSLTPINSPEQITIDFDPEFPWASLQRRKLPKH